MVAIEEELVAGESPDKSVDEGAPGAARSSAERDPRLSVLRPREPESGTSAATSSAASAEGRDPLREAVAAWVATTEDEAAGSSGRVDSDPTPADSERTAVFRAPKPAERKPAEPKPAERKPAAEEPKPAVEEPEPAAEESEPAAEESESGAASAEAGADTPAPAAAPKPDSAPAKAGTDAAVPTAPESGSDPASDEGDETAAKPTAAAKSDAAAGTSAAKPAHDSERTAVFRAVRPGAGTDAPASAAGKPVSGGRGPAAGSASDAADGDAPAAGSGSASAAADTPAKPSSAHDSERTAVFRAVRPGSKQGDSAATAAGSASSSGSGAAATTPSGAARPDSASASGAGKPAAGSASERKPAAAAAEASGKPSADDSERTALFRAVKPGSAPAKGGSGSEGAGSGSASAADASAKPSADDSERTAVFRAPKADSASASASGGAGKGSDEAADSERTAVFRAVKPDAKAPAPASQKPAGSRPVPPKAADGERASTFVPLRKEDGPAPKPAPAAPAAADSDPAPAPAKTPVPVPERTERTTQQPLPPKPPLDMLADLTNNPPPPPSPIRTAVRRVKIYAPLVALLVIILAVVQLVRPMPEPKLTMTAKSSYTFDGGNPVLPWPKEGQAYMAAAGLGTVGSFGEQKPVAIGSVAKTMTAYVILKNHPLKKGEKGPLIDIDKTAVDDGAKSSEGESTVGTLKAGDKINEYDALAAIMIPSANNVARLLARWDSGGDQDAFVKKMNEAAKELGMTNTTYTDPSGLDATTVSTAEDQVKLGLKVVEMPELIAITKLPEWTDQYGKKWRNYNTLIPGNGALGIKTGSTTKAGGNLLFAAEKQVGNTRQLIVGAVLGQYGVPILDTAIAASKQVMLATQKILVNAPVVKKGDVVGYVDDGLGGHTPVVATADVEAVGWPSLTVNVKLAAGEGKLPQTAKAGTEIGVLTVGEGASQVKVPVALQSDLAAPGIGSKLTRVG
ncbi:D-alanyl-D-alanine carboxypeptidase family protein [Streptomyces sp. NPDC127051]|uniref:D-alanyl-D-alanine carboxypeptidase family protein n=1 Tax=Streptomyces sp. NPDC127051 TaxID=3347119 RepID=UPI00364701ED